MRKEDFEQTKEGLKIAGSSKCQMISYFPNGSYQTKNFMCSCEKCADGYFVQCLDTDKRKMGKAHNVRLVVSDNESDSDGGDSDKENNRTSTVFDWGRYRNRELNNIKLYPLNPIYI